MARETAWLTMTALLLSACTPVHVEPVPEPTAARPPASATTSITTATTSKPPLSVAIRDWEAAAGDHFKESAGALRRINEASEVGDEDAVGVGCQVLHDTNTIGLQDHLPTPDPDLTAELQHMIDNINSATHACLRFVLAHHPEDATNYQEYLGRAVEHLQRAKAILAADRGPR